MANKTEWTISVKKGDRCSLCSGSGFIPLLDEKMSITDKYGGNTIELLCKECKGMGKIIEKVDLSLESLKEMINGLK